MPIGGPVRQWSQVHRLLAIRPDNIGDVVMVAPALRAVRAALPSASITLLASPAGAQVAPLLPWVDEVLVRRVVWQDASGGTGHDPAENARLVDDLRGARFDAALVFTSFSQSPWPPAYACYLAGIPLRAGESKEFGGAVLTTAAAPLPDDAHQVDRNLHLVDSVGIPTRGSHLELRIPAAARSAADALLEDAGIPPGSPFVAVAPGASCETRRYPPERLAEVVAALPRVTSLPAVVVGSERERPMIEPVLATGVASLVGRTSVPELAAVLARASLVVANNSGPMHIADAFGRPQVVLYGGAELVSQWVPRTSQARILRRAASCSPCHAFDCPTQLPCLDIPPDEVLAHVADLVPELVA